MPHKKILIVDDDQYIRELYVEILTDEKFDVDSAEDGIEGVDKLPAVQWKLANLAKMNGKKHSQSVDALKKALGL